MKKIAGVTLEQFMEKSNWVARFTSGTRIVGPYQTIKKRAEDPRCKDFDIVCKEGQPEELHSFMDEMERISNEHGWMTFPEMFDKFGIA